jgi:electron transfer flavoprotein beta subunit
MNILVCIKQVPQTESATEISPDGAWISRITHAQYKMNRFDEFALEEALLFKEKHPDVTVNVITEGPERARDVVKRAYGMGADNGTHIMTDHGGFSDPAAVAARIGREAEKGAYDLIFTGIMSEDMMQSQTGQLIAEHLGLPCVTSVVGVSLSEDGKAVHVKRELEGGMRSLLTVKLPCVLTIQAGINIPRYPTLSKILKANSKAVQTVSAEPMDNRQDSVVIRFPEKQRAGTVLQGSREDKARELARILRQKNIMR